jgi:hypothetical protein
MIIFNIYISYKLNVTYFFLSYLLKIKKLINYYLKWFIIKKESTTRDNLSEYRETIL